LRGEAPRRVLKALAPFGVLLIVVAVFYLIPPHPPVKLLDLRTIAVQTVIVSIAAMGMTFVIVSAGIDLSVGSAIALASVTAAMAMDNGLPLSVTIPVTLGAGALCGLYNGLLITVLRLPPFIATLGTLGFFRGVAKWISDSRPITAPTDGLELWVQPIPAQGWLVFAPAVWLMFGLAVLMALALRHSVLGRYAFAIGSNEATARLCGVRVERTKVFIYVLMGLMTGLAGLFQFARLTQGDPTVAVGLELDVIAAVVIGGASLAGGQGSIVGTLVGAFLMSYLRNRCIALGWPNFVQEMIIGHVIIVAVAADQWRLRRMFR